MYTYKMIGEGKWMVKNETNGFMVYCSSEMACGKIIKLAETFASGLHKPLNHKTLERKAKNLIGWRVL